MSKKQKTNETIEGQIKYPEVIAAIKATDYKILDKLATVLKGINTCVAVYVQQNGTLLISANCDPLEPITKTKYDAQCMLKYTTSLKGYIDNGDENLVYSVLAEDIRLKKQFFPIFYEVKTLIEKLQRKLTNDMNTKLFDRDEFRIEREDSQEEDMKSDNEDNQHDTRIILQRITNQLTIITDPTAYTRDTVMESFKRFINSVAVDLLKLQELQPNEIGDVNKIIVQLLPQIANKDLKFIENLKDVIQFVDKNPNNPFTQALSNDLFFVPEIDTKKLYTSLIAFKKGKGAYHAEHRTLIEVKDHQNDSYNHIGVSKLCCTICHFVIINHGGAIKITGTHGDYYSGDAFPGLRLHIVEEQCAIIKGLFPNSSLAEKAEQALKYSHDNSPHRNEKVVKRPPEDELSTRDCKKPRIDEKKFEDPGDNRMDLSSSASTGTNTSSRYETLESTLELCPLMGDDSTAQCEMS